MSETGFAGVYQLDNGFYGYRYAIVINGKRKEAKKVRNDLGKPFKTAKQAAKAREIAIVQEQSKVLLPQKAKAAGKSVEEVYAEYCEKGRSGKAYSTIKKQDSLWNNHLKERFGKRYIDDITVAEIQDYLEELYYVDRNPTSKLLLCIFIPFYLIYWIYISAQLIDKLASSKGVESNIVTICSVLAIFINIIPPIIMQDKINIIATAINT